MPRYAYRKRAYFLTNRRDRSQVGTFDPDPPTQRWSGRWDRISPTEISTYIIYRTTVGTWIAGKMTKRGPVVPPCGIPFDEIEPSDAAGWFSRNHLDLPDALISDLEGRSYVARTGSRARITCPSRLSIRRFPGQMLRQIG